MLSIIFQSIIKFNNSFMLVDKKDSKVKYTYVTDKIDPPSIVSKREPTLCLGCLSWQQKTNDLIWGYQDLLSAKQKEVETLTNMIDEFDEKIKKLHSKCQTLNKKNQAYQGQMQKNRHNYMNYENIINYYKQREAALLSQIKSLQNEIFTKNVIIKDDIDCKEQKQIGDLMDKSYKQNKAKVANTIKSDTSLLPIIQTTQSFGKLLQKNMCEMQKMSQQKMMLQVKYRMAVLRAVQMDVLK